MKRYGMMGGTFNPIHLAHLYIAYEAKEELNLDKIIFMVAGNPPHKKESKIIDSKYRYNMVQKAIEGYEGFEISDYEIKKNGYSYTYETLQYLKKQDDNDKRSYDVFITELGEKKVDEILKFYLGPIYDLRRKLGEKNFLQLMDCIKMANEKISEGENGK